MSFGVSKLKRRLHRLVCVYICQNATLLEITCHGSINFYYALLTKGLEIIAISNETINLMDKEIFWLSLKKSKFLMYVKTYIGLDKKKNSA